MRSKITVLLLLGSVSLPIHAADIYKWTDETGRVNYSNTVPERYKHLARRIDTGGAFAAADAEGQAAANRARAQAEGAASSSVGSSTAPGNNAESGSAGY